MTQSTNLKLDLLSATDLFDTDKIKSNFEKIDNGVLIPTKIIDNCVTDNSLLPLSAKQGKLLQDQITQLNGDFKANRWTKRISILSFTESWYTCPSDGYLFAYTNGEGINSSAGIHLNDTYQKISISPNSFSCLFMKQGMKIKIEVNDISKFADAFFCPFWD